MIVAVELRLISGCIIGTLIHDFSSLGIQRTKALFSFYIMYVYKVSLLFRIILSYVPRLSQ